jgi:hypothetical protein
MTVADSEANLAVYSKQRGGRNGASGYPVLRLLVLVSCGTRTVIDAVFGPVSAGKLSYAAGLPGSLHAGMVLLGDRLGQLVLETADPEEGQLDDVRSPSLGGEHLDRGLERGDGPGRAGRGDRRDRLLNVPRDVRVLVVVPFEHETPFRWLGGRMGCQPGGCQPMYSSARRLSSHLPSTGRNAS